MRHMLPSVLAPEPWLPRRRAIPILAFVLMLSLMMASTGIAIAGIWAIIRLIGRLL